jgi:hypothetical protein
LIVAGLPVSCGPEQLMSVVHAVTVITLEWLPGPMVAGSAT